MTDNTAKITGSTNPFLIGLSELLCTDDLESRLQFSPLTGVDVRSLNMQQRLDLLNRMHEELFEPTSTSLDIGTHVLRLIRRGYIQRDPTTAAARRKTMKIAGYSGMTMGVVPWFATYAKAMRIAGETGTGKTHEVIRPLKLLPQFIVRPEDRDAGWTHLVQVVWLYVAMSHDGSLGGLLLNILVELDAVAGTNYSTTKSIIGLSNEKLAVRIGVILRTHGVGVLVIDELQSRNFDGGAHGGLATTFFLRLLNFGIPMILIGNPFGLDALDKYAQDTRRTSSGGSFDMRPHAVTDFDWVECMVPGIWGYHVMPEPNAIQDPLGQILFQYSGGIRDYACRIRASMQRVALDLGASSATVDHMEQAFWGPDFSDKDRALIAGFRDRNPILLQSWDDVRWEEYAAAWNCFPSSDPTPPMDTSSSASESSHGDRADNTSGEGTDSADSSKSAKMSCELDLEAIKRKRTRRTGAVNKQNKVRSHLNPDDLRNQGLADYLIAGFEAIRRDS